MPEAQLEELASGMEQYHFKDCTNDLETVLICRYRHVAAKYCHALAGPHAIPARNNGIDFHKNFTYPRHEPTQVNKLKSGIYVSTY